MIFVIIEIRIRQIKVSRLLFFTIISVLIRIHWYYHILSDTIGRYSTGASECRERMKL